MRAVRPPIYAPLMANYMQYYLYFYKKLFFELVTGDFRHKLVADISYKRRNTHKICYIKDFSSFYDYNLIEHFIEKRIKWLFYWHHITTITIIDKKYKNWR